MISASHPAAHPFGSPPDRITSVIRAGVAPANSADCSLRLNLIRFYKALKFRELTKKVRVLANTDTADK